MVKFRRWQSSFAPPTHRMIPAVPLTSPGQAYRAPRVSLSPRFYKPWFLRRTNPLAFAGEVAKPQVELIYQGSILKPLNNDLAGYLKRKGTILTGSNPTYPTRSFAKRIKLQRLKQLRLLPSSEIPSYYRGRVPKYMEPSTVAELPSTEEEPIQEEMERMNAWGGRDAHGMMKSKLEPTQAVSQASTASTVGIGTVTILLAAGVLVLLGGKK